MEKKRLLVFHPTIAPYRVDLFNDLSQVFNAKICLAHSFDDFKDYAAIERTLTFKPDYLKTPKGDKYHAKASEILRVLRSYHADIVITGEFGVNTIISLLYRWICRRKYKVISICDDSYDMIANNNDFSWKHRLVRKLVTPLLDNLILVEPNVKDWYQKHYHKGIWFPIIRDDDKARIAYKRVLGKSQQLVEKYKLAGKHVFLFVGRLVALKNVKTIIEAFRRLNQENNVLVIIGSGEEEATLRALSADSGWGNVIFTGRLEGDELYSWYNVATAFILASYQEPFGAVTNEALLAGCWAIISKKAGSQCLVKPGENGDIFEPMDVDELSSKMEYVHKNLPAAPSKIELRKNGMACSYKDLLNNLISQLND